MSCTCGWVERGETLATAHCGVHGKSKLSVDDIVALVGEIRKTADKAYKKAEEDESADGYTASRLYARASMAEYIENKVKDAVKRGGV